MNEVTGSQARVDRERADLRRLLALIAACFPTDDVPDHLQRSPLRWTARP